MTSVANVKKKRRARVNAESEAAAAAQHLVPEADNFAATGALIAAFLPVLLLLPFVNKAFHVDDPLFVWTAQHVAKNPLDFYGFLVNWETTRAHMYEVMQNPPLLSYYVAPFGALFGWREWVLHLAMLVPTALAGLGMYLVAARFCKVPLLAALIGISTPAFLVSATQVMSDVPMTACWLWAMHLWMRGVDKEDRLSLVAGAALIGVGALTKYYALSLLPLLTVHTLLQGREKYHCLLYMLIPAGILLVFEFYTFRLYNLGLLIDAASFANQHRSREGVSALVKILTTLVFMGGCLSTTLILSPWMWSWRWLWILPAAILAVFLIIVVYPNLEILQRVYVLNIDQIGAGLYSEKYREPTNGQLLQWSVWLVAGCHVFFLAFRSLWKKQSADNLTLLLWIGGTFTFTAFLNHHVNARVVLPMAAAVAILAARVIIEHQNAGQMLFAPLWRRWALAGAFLFTLVICNADYQLANSARSAANAIMDRVEFGNVLFSGHSGFQYYMEARGAEAIDQNRSQALPGDNYVLPSNNWFPVLLDKNFDYEARLEEFYDVPTVSTSHYEAYAGFYSDYSGRMPFVFGDIPREKYLVLKLIRLKKES